MKSARALSMRIGYLLATGGLCGALACNSDNAATPSTITPPTPVASAPDTLRVTLTPGVVGTLPNGVTTAQRGATVPYQFAASPGYDNLRVSIDGQVVAAAGAIAVTGNRLVSATADTNSATVETEETAKAIWKDLIAQADDPISSRMFMQRRMALMATRSAMAVDSLARLGMILIAASYADISAMHRILGRADSMRATAIRNADVGTSASAQRSRSAAHSGANNSIAFIYVNGINSGTEGTSRLQELVGGAASVIPVENPSAVREEVVKLNCAMDVARLLFAKSPTRSVGYAFKCALYAASGILVDAAEAAAQLWAPNTPIVRTLATSVVADLVATASGFDGVVFVGHSQGNLFIQEAITQLRDEQYPKECMGYVAIASPRRASLATIDKTAISPFSIVVGSPSRLNAVDFIASISGEVPTPNELSVEVGRSADTPFAPYLLHSLVDSYLAAPTSSRQIHDALIQQLGAVASGCTATRARSPNSRLRLSPTTLSMTEGDNAALKVDAITSTGSIIAKPSDVVWTSSDRSVATVTSFGGVAALRAGQVDITAASSTNVATAHVTVAGGAIARIVVQAGGTVMAPGTKQQLSATLVGAGAQILSARTLAWSSSDAHVATVASDGVVTAGAVGTTRVRASVGNLSGFVDIVVSTSQSVSSPYPLSPGASISPGGTLTTLTPTFTWSSVAGATTYGLYVRDLSVDAIAFEGDNVATSPMLTIPAGKLVAGHAYRWYTKAFNSSGPGGASPYFYFQAQDASSGAAPTVSLTANPVQLAPGQSTTLAWSSTNATLCVADWATGSGQVPVSGTAVVAVPAGGSFTILCSGAPPNALTASAMVAVTAPRSTNSVSIALSATPLGAGSVSLNGGSASDTYRPGDAVAARAIPGNGFTFVEWRENGAAVTTANPYQFQATVSRNLSAVFITAPTSSAPPTVVTLGATGLSGVGFQMNGTVTPNGGATQAYFEWGRQANLSDLAATTVTQAGAGQAAVTLAFPFSGALCGTTYYYRAVGVPSTGIAVRGDIVSATTSACVTSFGAITQSASNITETGMRLNGVINQGGSHVAGFFGYHPSGSTFFLNTPAKDLGTGTGSAPYFVDVTGLTCGTVYTFHAIGTTSTGAVATGTDLTASTSSCSTTGPQLFTFAATVNPAGTGTVTGTGDYPLNSAVTLTAVPSAGYNFSNWIENGSVISTSNPITLDATSSRTFVATFAPIPVTPYQISVYASPSGGGTVTGAGPASSGSTVTLTATPAAGFRFANWMNPDGSVPTTSIPRTYTFTATADRTIIANFESTNTSLGSMFMIVRGLPVGASANITVVGANNPYAGSASRTGVLTGLPPDIYVVTAFSVTVGGRTYTPSPQNTNPAVTANGEVYTTIDYK